MSATGHQNSIQSGKMGYMVSDINLFTKSPIHLGKHKSNLDMAGIYICWYIRKIQRFEP